MWRHARPAAIIIAAISISVPALAFIQERVPSGDPVRWNLAAVQPNISNGMVKYVINKRGSGACHSARSSLSRYPTPASVWKMRGRAGSGSSFRRRWAM